MKFVELTWIGIKMPSQHDMDEMYMGFCLLAARRSKARRKKVGGALVKDDNIISFGWNGTPAGDDNNCEHELEDGSLVTKQSVSHCELNVYGKLLNSPHPVSTHGSILYLTISPCMECAKLIRRAGTAEVVYLEEYRDVSGIEFLKSGGISVRQFYFDEEWGETQI